MTKQIIGSELNLNWLIVAAFRYAVRRHTTQAMYGIGDVILDNLDLVQTGFIKQFIRDIESEREYDKYVQKEKQEADTYFFKRLEGHVKDYIRYLRDEPDEKAKEVYDHLNEVLDLIPQVKLRERSYDFRLLGENTDYLLPMLNKLREELVKRRERL